MGFLKNSVSFTRYQILDDLPRNFTAELPDKLRQFAFKDIDDLPQERAWGWVCFENMLDAEWRESGPQKGADHLAFSLRLDTRRVPPAVLKKHFALALREEEGRIRAQGKSYVSRERRKEIRERVLFELNRRFLPIPAEFQVIWNLSSRRLFIATISNKALDLFEEYFLHSFGLRLERLTPYGLAAAMLQEKELDRLNVLEPTNFRK
ncbi:MAG: recombination-associated protein RdgC [Desulfovibrionaceae bacterium]|nr:recombination-associated protein RdgC [Desulfovibrionaceae bacterium]